MRVPRYGATASRAGASSRCDATLSGPSSEGCGGSSMVNRKAARSERGVRPRNTGGVVHVLGIVTAFFLAIVALHELSKDRFLTSSAAAAGIVITFGIAYYGSKSSLFPKIFGLQLNSLQSTTSFPIGKCPEFSGANLATFAAFLSERGGHWSRIHERVEVLTRALRVTQQLTMRNDDGADNVFLPILMLDKGILVDDSRITLSGLDVPILTFTEYGFLVKEALRSLAAVLPKDREEKYLLEFEDEVIDLVCGRKPLDTKEFQRAGETLGGLQVAVGDSDAARLMQEVCNTLTMRYVVVGHISQQEFPLDVSDWIVVKTDYRLIEELERPKIWSIGKFVFWIRTLLGVRSSTFSFGLTSAPRAQSYHLEFMGPEGTYLARQGPMRPNFREHAKYSRFRRRLGQRYAHLYVRNASPEMRDDRVWFTFWERTPGSLGSATVAAVAGLLIIYTGGAISSGHGKQDGTDLMAVFLAFPGVAAAWVGLDRSTGPVGGVLGACISSVVTVICVLAGMLLWFQVVPYLVDDVHIVHAYGPWGGIGRNLGSERDVLKFLMVAPISPLRARPGSCRRRDERRARVTIRTYCCILE